MKLLSVGTENILKMEIREDHLSYEWNPEWQKWEAFMEDKEVKDLIEKVNKMMQNKGKGLSKGKTL